MWQCSVKVIVTFISDCCARGNTRKQKAEVSFDVLLRLQICVVSKASEPQVHEKCHERWEAIRMRGVGL